MIVEVLLSANIKDKNQNVKNVEVVLFAITMVKNYSSAQKVQELHLGHLVMEQAAH